MAEITKPSELDPVSIEVMMTVLNRFARMAYGNSHAKGFWDEYEETLAVIGLQLNEAHQAKYTTDVKLSKIDLIHSELGEMTEGVRKPGPDQHCPEFTQEEIEAADAFIRLMDYVGKFDLRFGPAVMAKMEYNASRPYKHGKAA